MRHPASHRGCPAIRVLILVTSVVLALAFTLYLLETSFRDDGRILAPDAAISVPVLWIGAGLVGLRFPRIAVVIYAMAAMLLFFGRDDYHGFIVWGCVSLMLAALALWCSFLSVRSMPPPEALPTQE